MAEKKEFTAILLAGGKSSRMMEDKGLIELQGKKMIEHTIEKLKEITEYIIIITKNPAYRQFGYPCFGDIYKDLGPLGGIYTGLVNSTTEINLVLGCDTPFLSSAILKSLIDKSNSEDVLVTVHRGKTEPLCAVYKRKCAPHFQSFLEKGKLKVTDAFAGLHMAVMNFDYEKWVINDEFTNINTPEELKKYKK